MPREEQPPKPIPSRVRLYRPAFQFFPLELQRHSTGEGGGQPPMTAAGRSDKPIRLPRTGQLGLINIRAEGASTTLVKGLKAWDPTPASVTRPPLEKQKARAKILDRFSIISCSSICAGFSHFSFRITGCAREESLISSSRLDRVATRSRPSRPYLLLVSPAHSHASISHRRYRYHLLHLCQAGPSLLQVALKPSGIRHQPTSYLVEVKP